MKLRVDAKSFVESVAWATKNYDAKNEKSHVKLKIEKDGEYYLSHGNTTSYMRQNFTVNGEKFEDGEDTDTALALDGKFLQRLSAAVPNTGEIILTKDLTSRKTSLSVKTSQGSFTIPLFITELEEEPDFITLGDVNDNEFFQSLARIAKVSDSANTGNQSFIGAIDVKIANPDDGSDATIGLFATDRYAMSEIKLPFDPAEIDADDEEVANKVFNKSFLLPAASASIVPATKGLVTDVSLVVEDNKSDLPRFGYHFPDDRLALFSLMNVKTFPNFETVLTRAFDAVTGRIDLNTADVTNAIKTISNLAWDDDDIFFFVTSDELIVSDRSRKNRISIPTDLISLPEVIEDDDPIVVRFVRSVINAAMSPVSTSKMRFGFNAGKVELFALNARTEDGTVLDNVSSVAIVGKQ